MFAETAASAKFDGMLLAAASGVVDHTHPPRDIARVLCGLPLFEGSPEPTVLSDDPAMDTDPAPPATADRLRSTRPAPSAGASSAAST